MLDGASGLRNAAAASATANLEGMLGDPRQQVAAIRERSVPSVTAIRLRKTMPTSPAE